MGKQIGRGILESYLLCKTKSHLKISGECGKITEYESFLLGERAKVRDRAIAGIPTRCEEGEAGIIPNEPATLPVLKRRSAYILDTRVELDGFCLDIDALMRVPGESALGDFHYVPVLYQAGEKIRREQQILLASLGCVLGDIQGRQPGFGVVYRAGSERGSKVRFSGPLRERPRPAW